MADLATNRFAGTITPAETDRPTEYAHISGIDCIVDNGPLAEWDGLLSEFDDASLPQSAHYNEQTWSDRTLRLLVKSHGRVLGGAVVVIMKSPFLEAGLAYIKFGPFWRRRGETVDFDNYSRIIQAFKAELCDRRGHHMTIIPRPEPTYKAAIATRLALHDFKVRRKAADPNRYLVKVLDSEAVQSDGLQQKWRYNLRKSLKNSLDIVEDNSADGFETFSDLHFMMVGRKQFRNVDRVGGVPALMQALPPAMQPRIYLARQHGEAVAGAVVCDLGDTAYYVYGASSRDALKYKAGYALQWTILNDLRDRGVKWYDLGGEAEDSGLRQFKNGFVGKTGEAMEMLGEHDYWVPGAGHLVADGIYGIRALMRFARSRLKVR